jgi:DNA-binding transcriptional regulator YbjK
LNWKKLPKVLLLSGGAALVGWWCFHAAAGEALAVRNPTAAAAIVPNDPRVALGLARMEFRLKQGEGDPAVMRRAAEALAEVPLASEPFFFAGLAALSARDEAKGQQLVLEARRRAPRDSVTRIVALDGLLRARRVADAVAEITVISQLLPESAQVLIPELARFARNPETRGTLAEVLRKNPRMQNQMLEHLAGNGTDPDIVLALAPPLAPGRDRPEWQRRLLQAVVDKGDISRARALWARFAGVDPAKLEGSVYDPQFQGLPGPAPFNWQFSETAAGVAEPTRAPALQVEYYGRADAELASQLLMLRPGSYRISFQALGATPGTADRSAVAWQLSCHPGKAELATIPIRELSYKPKRIGGSFSVPSSCSAVLLRLIGTPAEFPAAQSITISDLQVQRS